MNDSTEPPKAPMRHIEILLVEDNEGDVFLTKRAFQKAKIYNRIEVAKDGEAAFDILHKKGPYTDAVKPDLILLDINLPKMSGIDLLDKIKHDPNLKRIPVVILTSSQAEKDIIKTYDLHASSYIVKPIDILEFNQVISAIENFWFSVVTLPTFPDVE